MSFALNKNKTTIVGVSFPLTRWSVLPVLPRRLLLGRASTRNGTLLIKTTVFHKIPSIIYLSTKTCLIYSLKKLLVCFYFFLRNIGHLKSQIKKQSKKKILNQFVHTSLLLRQLQGVLRSVSLFDY